MEYGLLSRVELSKRGIISEVNDEERNDGCLDAICLSISHPNYKMFYPLRCDNPSVDWAVFQIKPRVLWRKDCAFCVSNAACTSVTCIPISERKGVQAFLKMFENHKAFPPRDLLDIDDSMPTNPQAEVLVFDKISIDDIVNISFENFRLRQKYAPVISGDIKTRCNPSVFKGRKDWRHWKKED